MEQQKIFVVTSNGIYEGDSTSSTAVFFQRQNAEAKFDEWTQKALDDCTTSDGEKPLNIDNMSEEDMDGLSDEYVYEHDKNGNGDIIFRVYSYGNYNDDHVEIQLTETAIMDYDGTRFTKRTLGLHKPSNSQEEKL